MDRTNSKHDINNIESGRFDLTRNTLTKKIDNLSKRDIVEYRYNMRSFHDFAKFRVSYVVAIIKEMAYCGQISKCYKYNNMATLLAIFLVSRHSCPVSSVQYLGSKLLFDMSYLKLFGNGLVENYLRRFIKEENIE